MADGLDYEHEFSNGWNKYEIMVLGEMKRLADNDTEKTKALAEVASALNTVSTMFNKHVEDSDKTDDDFEGRLRTLEAAKNQADGWRKLKGAVVPVAASLFASGVGWVIMILAYFPKKS